MDVPRVEVMVPQHHPLGEEAEVDVGSASVYLAGCSLRCRSSSPCQRMGHADPGPRPPAPGHRVTFNAHILETGTDRYRLRATRTGVAARAADPVATPQGWGQIR